VLRWAGWAPTPQALVLASTIGADVGVCLAGGRARVRGIGEVVDPLPTVAMTFTLVVAPLQVSTPAVYQAWDHLGGPTADGPNDL
jgi:4-diphosphocytidyl-2-C-methyl-D-erythritol kinase